MWRIAVAGVAALVVTGCTQPLCTPNQTQACACDGPGGGVQTCSAEGTAFSACTCTPRCEPDTCQGHGSCSVDDTGVTCACFAAYEGARCERCAPGAEDPEGDGTCALVRCEPDTCSGHGTCELDTGAPRCTCEAGYAGARCASCDQGFERDASGACVMPTCVRERCNGRGLCGDDLSCACFAAYTGEACERCATGFQDLDGDGTCAPSCAVDTCGGHGTCVDTSGAARCSCDALHTGPDCAACAPGAQDNDGDGTCAPGCASAGLTCASSAACSDASGTARCACGGGYVDDGFDLQGRLQCRWAGLLVDPGLPQGSASWQVLEDAGVQWLASTPGQRDPGALSVPGSAPAAQQLFAWQDLVVPPATVPWAIDAKYDSTSLGVVRVGAATVLLPASSTGMVSACVGDAFEPGPTRVSLGSLNGLLPRTFPQPPAMTFDHVTLRPGPECPAPGALPNGDFTSGTAGWDLENARITTESGASALRLPSNGCFASNATRLLSVPSRGVGMPNALRFTSTRTGDALATGLLALDREFTDLATDGSLTQLCVPAALRGRVVSLLFRALLSVACGVPRSVEFTVDDLEFFYDTDCAVQNGFINPGFQTNAGWKLGGSAVLLTDGSARSRVLRINTPTVCGGGAASQAVLAPMPSGTAGPALRFRYTAQGPTSVPAVVIDTNLLQLPKTTGWETKLICIPPRSGGLPVNISLQANAYGGCGVAISGETASFDDVELVTDPSCPAQ
ncbi:MAG: hypothetical protein ACO1OB_21375 [Archangium sp.]